MELSSAIRLGHPIAFSLFIFFSLVVAIIASAVTADFNSNGGYDKTVTRDSTRFMVFTGWWSFLFGVIFVCIIGSSKMGRSVNRCANSFSWFYSSPALAVLLRLSLFTVWFC